MENIERYYVKQTGTGFVICEISKTIPLPFNFIKKQTAEDYAKEFNKYGKIAVAKYYYTSKVAGNRILPDYKYAYEKWLVENYKNFDW